MTDQHSRKLAFASLDLPPGLLQGIEETGFSHCTPIQAETLPLALAGQDVAGQAQTGTGKTAAFLIAVFKTLLTGAPAPEGGGKPRALILAPTRELAVQIHKDAEQIGKHTGLRQVAVFGGTGYDTQRQAIEEGVDVLIGTPGRVIDYFKQKVFGLKHLQVMVLDEADRMFDLGFIKDIRFLLRRMPPPEQRLSMLFSATLSYRVTELAYEHMNNPVQVRIEPEQVTAERVREEVYFPAREEKIPLLLGLISRMEQARSMVFVNTKAAAERVTGYLLGNGYRAGVLSGDVPQRKRLQLLDQFMAGELPILVATDVAARGLHVEGVTHVFNYDLPQDAEDYVHRIGRTARAGAAGEAISFACEEYAFSLEDIESYIGHKIPVGDIEPELLLEAKPPQRVHERGAKPPARRSGSGRKRGRSGQARAGGR